MLLRAGSTAVRRTSQCHDGAAPCFVCGFYFIQRQSICQYDVVSDRASADVLGRGPLHSPC